MSKPKIQLLIFEGCPLADAARESLETALNILGSVEYEEIDLLDPETADEIRGWGSPTILVNGKDVTGALKGDSVACRVYPGPERVPSTNAIADFILAATKTSRTP